ncbi:LAQU0S03e00826g1_1 [Lachancea quebecensis]|uniref:Protein YAE1 n=1 Tax=Lachancea quebecensis TaxID=1654605 RepID=A0A0P1KNL0_9SACH|nr:LAQU0S03e00826g1_1 [Lachancea quebecensis]
MSFSDDDVWGSESDGTPEAVGSAETVEVRKLRLIHSKRGYLDGISSSKEENLQKGFDDSFEQGAELGKRVGKVLGELHILGMLYGRFDEKLAGDLIEAQKELKINKVLSTKHFDENCNLLGVATPLDKWEKILGEHQKRYM